MVVVRDDERVLRSFMKPARSYLLDRLIANGCIVEFTLEDSPDVAFLGNYVVALIAALCSNLC